MDIILAPFDDNLINWNKINLLLIKLWLVVYDHKIILHCICLKVKKIIRIIIPYLIIY